MTKLVVTITKKIPSTMIAVAATITPVLISAAKDSWNKIDIEVRKKRSRE